MTSTGILVIERRAAETAVLGEGDGEGREVRCLGRGGG